MKRSKYTKWLLLCLILISSSGCNHTWQWIFVGAPMGDVNVSDIYVDPTNDDLWYVTSWNGLYITRNSGNSWVSYLDGFVGGFEIDPNYPNRVYASSGSNLYKSIDRGMTWEFIHTFPKSIYSILISEIDGSIFVGLHWEDSNTPNGIYRSSTDGVQWDYYSYAVPEKGLICWDIEEDHVNGILYVSTEIYDHPVPYDPPFLRSTDGGQTWQNISGNLPWHVVKIQVSPEDQRLYVLTEGSGIYYSDNHGDTWYPKPNVPFTLNLLIDRHFPDRVFAGEHTHGNRSGGVHLSTDGGDSFDLIGLSGKIAGGLYLNGPSTRVYTACYGTGIYVSKRNLQTPTLTDPENGAILDNGCLDRSDDITWDFGWSDVSGAHKYHIYVKGKHATHPLVDLVVTSSSYHHFSGSSYIVEQNRSDWTWRVRAGSDFGEWSSWTEERSFDVEPLNTDCQE